MLSKSIQDRIRILADTDNKECNGEDYDAGYSAGAWIGGYAEACKAQLIVEALEKFISMHETGLLPNKFTYEDAKKALEEYRKD